MSGGAVFEYGWREDHARAGDEALLAADHLLCLDPGSDPSFIHMTHLQRASALAALAQAHYAAANIRTRPIRDAELPVTDTSWMTRERTG